MALLNIIIFLACLQSIFLIVLIIATLLVKLRLDYFVPIKQKRRENFKQALINYPNIAPPLKKELLKHLHMTFVVFLEKNNTIPEKKLILQEIFLPQLHQRAHGRIWYDRYMAAVIIQFIHQLEFDLETKSLLMKLIHDPVALVSVNALKAISSKPDGELFNEVILIFSKLKKSQLELMLSTLKKADFNFIQIIHQRLLTEKDTYIRAFCYRILQDLPMTTIKMAYLSDDLHHSSINVALSAIAYLNYTKKSSYKIELCQLLKDPRWQIKARCLKYLGRTKDTSLIESIKPCLVDENWWVRYRAAEALSHLGKKGQLTLSKENIDLNQFAEEISSQRLILDNLTKEERL